MKRYLPLALSLLVLYVYLVGRSDPALLAAAGDASRSEAAPYSYTQQSPLSISKIAYPDPAVAGSPLFYVLTLHNSGSTPLSDVVVSDTLPAGTRFAYESHDCHRSSDNVLYCAGLSVPPGGHSTTWFGVRVEDTAQSQVVNQAYGVGAPGLPPAFGPPVAVGVVTPTPTPDPYPGPTVTPAPPPAESVALPTPGGEPRLVLSQSVSSPTADAGGEVVHHIVVTNQGSGAARDVVLAVQVPAGVQVHGVTITPEAANEWTGSILWVAWGYLEAGASASVELKVTLLPEAFDPESVGRVGLPDYGIEMPSALGLPPQALPETGEIAPCWGWIVFTAGLLIGGWLLRRELHRGDPGA